MRMRTRSYAVAFAAGAAVTGLTMQHQQRLPVAEALFLTRPLTRSNTRITTIRRCDIIRGSGSNRNNNNHDHGFGYHSPCRTASRTDADTETETETISIRRKSYGAPVVDSTLLRFVSQQKQVPGLFREKAFREEDDDDDEAEAMAWSSSSGENENSPVVLDQRFYEGPIGSSVGNGSDCDSMTNAIKEKLAEGGSFFVEGQETIDDDNNEEEEEDNDVLVSKALTDADPETKSWMAQFGCRNVAQLLLSIGDVTDEASARTAGDAVERYCVVRTARRRIRRFLKERDTLWATNSFSGSSSSRSELESLAASDMASSPAASLLLSYAEQRERERLIENGVSVAEDEDGVEATPSYGFGDVVDVMREYGLTGNDICILLTHSPNLALRVPRKSFLREGRTDDAETLEETLERSLKGLLVSTLGLRRYDARKVLRTCPGLLSVRGSKAAVEVVTIMTKLGVSEKSLARDKSSLPVLLSRSPAGLFRLVAFLSSAAIRMPLEQIGPLLRRRVGRDLMDALLPVPNTSYSKMLPNAGATNAGAVAVNATSSVATQTDASAAEASGEETSLEDDAFAWRRTRIERQERIERTYGAMMQTAVILKAQIGTQDLSKVVSAYPNVLLLDAEKQILPVARYLMGGLGIWQNDLSGVLQLYPTLLGTKIEDLERVVSYALSLGVDEDDLAGIFRAFPGLFAMNVEDMEGVVSYLKSIGVDDVGAFVTKLPPVLGYSVEQEIRPKWEFLKTVCLQPEYELKEFPAYLSYPFERVIKTRFNYLAYKGISIRFVSMRIDTVLRFGDVDFATKVALDDDNGEAFRLFASSRAANGAVAAQQQKMRNKKKKIFRTSAASNAGGVNEARRNRQNEARAALAAAQRLSEDIDNAKNLAELNRIFREAAPLRNRSLGDSLPSLSPSRPKRKKRRKSKEQQQQQEQPRRRRQQPQMPQGGSNNNGAAEGPLPFPA
eukprot:CAMPEP_0197177252 /NCGR_PEP_ID=MMETSP1423-20130617/2928_1 /TAXON_ID=476441 /ORGANISM="Pseudo-nitzschia heimii, Strain UNC1101" /LENGTH=955 /DNA_ID=CAMNT_0042626775 /DNA_START=269 /DNA_END=3136 /DNA_ORIENTATION=+